MDKDIKVDVKSDKYLDYLKKHIFGGEKKAKKILEDPKYAAKVQKIWEDRAAEKKAKRERREYDEDMEGAGFKAGGAAKKSGGAALRGLGRAFMKGGKV